MTKQHLFKRLLFRLITEPTQPCFLSGFVSFSLSCYLSTLKANTLLFLLLKCKHERSRIQTPKPMQMH